MIRRCWIDVGFRVWASCQGHGTPRRSRQRRLVRSEAEDAPLMLAEGQLSSCDIIYRE